MSQKKMAYLDEKFKDDSSYKKESIGLNADDLVISHANLMKKPMKEMEYVLFPILPKDGYLLLHAEAGAGKTYFALNCAYAIAQGGRFLKFAASQPQKVLYVDAEMGEDSIRRRIEFLGKIHGQLCFDNLYYLNFNTCPNGLIPKIDTQEGRDFYTEHLVKGGYKGIFIDNLLTMSAIDHNKATEWQPIQDWILALRRLGIFFILLHHTSQDVTKQLGTIAHKTVATNVISLQKIDDEETGRVKVIYEKMRESAPGVKSFEAINNFDGSWSVNELEQSTYQQVVAWFKLNATGVQIAKTLNIKPQTVSDHKKRAIEKGDLRTNGYGKIQNLD